METNKPKNKNKKRVKQRILVAHWVRNSYLSSVRCTDSQSRWAVLTNCPVARVLQNYLVFLNTHTHTHTHTHTRTHARTQTHTPHTHARTHARTRTHAHARTHTHTHTRTHAHAHTHTHTRARAQTNVKFMLFVLPVSGFGLKFWSHHKVHRPLLLSDGNICAALPL